MNFSRQRPVKVVMLGAGGTGAHIAPHLYRLLYALERPVDFIICDGDTVESKNLVRQNFTEADLGENKAKVIAERYSDAFGLELLDHGDYAVDMRGPPDVEVVVVEFRVGGVAVGEDEGVAYDLVAVASEGLDPTYVPVVAVLSYDFVDDIPCVEPAVVPSGYGLDVLAHGFDEFFTALGLAVLAEPVVVGSLVVPDEGVSEHPEVVLLAVLHEGIGSIEVPFVRSGMNPFGFHVVAGSYCVEVLEEEFFGLGEASADSEGVDCASYLEAVCVGLLE